MKLTDQQSAAITTTADRVCVDAGAGSGKTFVLVERMVHLLEQRRADLDEIVAITFTEKAAAEMKARLRKAFRDRAGDQAETMTRWRDLERRLDGARISTIHAFCMRLLKENALALGIDPDFALLTEAENATQREQVVRDTLHRLLGEDHPAAMRLATEFRISQINKLLLELMPAGYALEPARAPFDYSDAKQLEITWRKHTDKHFREKANERHLVPIAQAKLAELQALNGSCSEPTDKREVARLKLIAAITRLLEGELDAIVLGRAVAEIPKVNMQGGSKKNWSPESDKDLVKEIRDELSEVLLALMKEPTTPEVEAESAAMTAALVQVFQCAWTAWTDFKEERRVMDFDDLVHRTAHALDASESLRDDTAAGIQFLLIDEFQDTDQVQQTIARRLNEAPDGPALFIVGDPKQSIYRFRGADVEVFDSERAHANEVLPLNQNFRTVAPILTFVNDFFRKSAMLEAVEPDFLGLEPFRAADNAPRVEFLLPPNLDDGAKRKAEEGREAEAALIAARIAELCGPGGPELIADGDTFRRAEPRDVAILLRAMSNIHIYEEALRRAGIDYGLVAGAGFYQRQEVLDILNLLKVALDPWDEPALLAVLRGPACALSDDALFALTRGRPLSRAFQDRILPDTDEPIAEAWRLIADLHASRHLPADQFLELLLDRTQIEPMLHALPMGLQRAANVRKLADLAIEFSSTRAPSLRTYTRYLDEMRSRAVREGEALMQPSEAGAVTIMTVHKSKGLEFPIVFLADCGAKIQGDKSSLLQHKDLGPALPAVTEVGERDHGAMGNIIKARNKDESLAEHARLLYVGMTRARDYLVLSGAPEYSNDSWLASLDQTYHPSERQDGDTIHDKGWRAIVRRDAKPGARTSAKSTPDNIDWTATLARATRPMPEVTAIETISVTALLNALSPDADIAQDEQRHDAEPDTRALARGTLVHEYFERWNFKEDPPDSQTFVDESDYPQDARAKLTQDLEAMAAWFRESGIFPQLSDNTGELREHPFALRIDDTLLSGTIDLLLADGTIIDYKTGRYHADKHQRYQWQLQWYAAAVRALTPLNPPAAYLAYVDEQRLEPVPVDDPSVTAALDTARQALHRLADGAAA